MDSSQREGVFWSLVSWVGGIAAFAIVYFVMRRVLGGTAPDGLIFGSVAFVLVIAILTFQLGPKDRDRPVVSHAHEPRAAAQPAAAPVPPVERAPAAARELPASDLVNTPSERVRDAARAAGEAARLAAGLDEAPAAAVAPQRPARLDAPRGGAPDSLRRIKGLGPKLEEMLFGLGYYHFDQIAAWTPAEVAWIDANLEGFRGRATRDDWVGQARLLASGGETEFSQRVDRGEVY